MEYYYLVVLVLLFILATMDLTVGVANDAVNFLNSGWGSRSLPFKGLLLVASLGVFVGALFAGGMMEVARRGVFHPQFFMFEEIIMIYFAVMLNDVLLIDIFNTLGLPTSTTVSLVSALMGAAFSYAIIKVSEAGEAFSQVATYINTDKALGMMSAIFISIAIAFFFGLLIQYIARVIFSFKYSRYKIGGAIFGGIAITLISYFIFYKGIKGAAFISADTKQWVTDNFALLAGAFTCGLTLIFIFLQYAFKVNVYRLIVIYGTFAVAMAFAGNDLVNFLGPSLAGLDAFQVFKANGGDPTITMEALNSPANVPPWILLLAGLIMLLTLWFNKKTRTVIRTEVGLGSEVGGVEKFEANSVGRGLVKLSIGIGKVFSLARIPAVHNWIERRFEKLPVSKDPDAPAFDMVRGAVNLTVASSLIAFGTSLKLPLSTTYVTFMVAMGTSLADRAWDRDSAVYRVSGVVTVIGGWFITAFLAFLSAAFLAYILYLGGIVSVALLSIFAIFLIVRSNILHRKREKAFKEAENMTLLGDNLTNRQILDMSNENVLFVLDQIPIILENEKVGLEGEKIKILKKTQNIVKEIDKKTNLFKNSVNNTISAMGEDYLSVADFYVKNAGILREITVSLRYIVFPTYQHINNKHKTFNKAQLNDLTELSEELIKFTEIVKGIVINKNKTERKESLDTSCDLLRERFQEIRKEQIRRVKSKESASRTSILLFNIITEMQNLSKFLNDIAENELKYHKLIND